MRFSKRWLWLAGLVAVVTIAGAACGDDGDGDGDGATSEPETPETTELSTDFGVTDTEIILGQTSVQSVASVAGAFEPILPAQRAYFDKVNAEDGGVCGRQIRLVDEDDQYAPDLALTGAQKLVQQDQILAFIGNLGTNAVSGQVEFINDPNADGDTSDGVPHLFLSTGAAKWDDPEQWPWTIGYIPDYTSESTVFAQYANDNFSGQTVGILYQNDEFGEDGRAGFTAAFEGEIIAEESYEVDAVDVKSQMANLRSANPDILLLYSIGLATRSAYLYMEENDWHPQVVSTYVNPTSLVATLLAGEDDLPAGYAQLAGTIQVNYLLDPVADAEDPAMVEHARIMDTYGGPTPGQLTLYGQSLAELTVETLEIACDNGDMTRAGVLAAAESIQGFVASVYLDGVEVNLSPTDHFAIQAFVPVQAQEDGTLKPLGDLIDVEGEAQAEPTP